MMRAELGVVAAIAGALWLPVTAAAQPGGELRPHDTHDMMEWGVAAFVLSEVLEYAPATNDRPVRYDLVGWVGGPWNRLWAKADGEQSTEASDGHTEVQLLYGRLISPFWDAQVGLRGDAAYGQQDGAETRVGLVLALQGLAPGWFEVEPSVFVSHRGDVSASVTASYDLRSQRLVWSR